MSLSTEHRRSRTGLGAALLTAMLAALVWVPAPAVAAGSFCEDQGVNVVVDFKDLGGGVQQACVEDGAGKMASEVFADAGFELTPVGAFPGAACRVDGKPADAACADMPPANAYWGLYVGAKGKWGYAPKGANELAMADGDYVGFAWQTSKTSSPPEVAPKPQPASDTASEPASDSEANEDDGGIPWWVPVGVVVVLLAAGVAIALRRRSS